MSLQHTTFEPHLKISKGVNVRCYLGVPALTGSHVAGSAHFKRLYVQQIFLHQSECAAVQDKGASEMAVGRPKLNRLQVWESVKQRQIDCFGESPYAQFQVPRSLWQKLDCTLQGLVCVFKLAGLDWPTVCTL